MDWGTEFYAKLGNDEASHQELKLRNYLLLPHPNPSFLRAFIKGLASSSDITEFDKEVIRNSLLSVEKAITEVTESESEDEIDLYIGNVPYAVYEGPDFNDIGLTEWATGIEQAIEHIILAGNTRHDGQSEVPERLQRKGRYQRREPPVEQDQADPFAEEESQFQPQYTGDYDLPWSESTEETAEEVVEQDTSPNVTPTLQQVTAQLRIFTERFEDLPSAWQFSTANEMVDAVSEWDTTSSLGNPEYLEYIFKSHVDDAYHPDVTKRPFMEKPFLVPYVSYDEDMWNLTWDLKLRHVKDEEGAEIIRNLSASPFSNDRCYYIQFIDNIVISESKEFPDTLFNRLVRLASHHTTRGNALTAPSNAEVGFIERVWQRKGKDAFRVGGRDVAGTLVDNARMQSFIQTSMKVKEGNSVVREVRFDN